MSENDVPTPAQDQPSTPARSLAGLRAAIDATDHELLQLLAQRNALVAQVAAVKRTERRPIRDADRETTLLRDRRAHADALGLAPDLIESLFRLVLWASRDRQAALKVEAPLDLAPKTVAIIGGEGGMGRCLARLLSDLGCGVLSADLDTTFTPADAAREADVVIISVPIAATEHVIAEVGPLVRDDALLMDVTSAKAGPVAAMLAATERQQASVVGAHPLFGPAVHSLQGQRVVLTRGRGDAWFDWVRRMFAARGLVVVESTPQEHDAMMAIVQVLTHFSTEVLGRTLTDLRVDLARTQLFTSPIYMIELLMTARHFGQSAELYAGIQMSNPDTERVLASFCEAADKLRDVVNRRDVAAFAEAFANVRRHFGPLADEALEKSSFLIDRLVERM